MFRTDLTPNINPGTIIRILTGARVSESEVVRAPLIGVRRWRGARKLSILCQCFNNNYGLNDAEGGKVLQSF